MSDFLKEHFSVLLVSAILVVLLIVHVLEVHSSGNDAVISWLESKISEALSAIFMGLGGPAVNRMVDRRSDLLGGK